ncbi:hypothetical protein [Salinispora arenicola]|nr:hypothetical protein [Salinispora arenicola]
MTADRIVMLNGSGVIRETSTTPISSPRGTYAHYWTKRVEAAG